jgi:hypothetical protein
MVRRVIGKEAPGSDHATTFGGTDAVGRVESPVGRKKVVLVLTWMILFVLVGVGEGEREGI